MRLLDVIFGLPPALLSILVAACLGPGLMNMLIAMTIVVVPMMGRVAYQSVAAVQKLPFIDAARASGASRLMLWKGTWHALTRFPVRRSGARLAFLSEKRTQQELEDAQRGGPRPTLTEKIDLSELYGSHISIVDPAGLMRTS